MKLRWSTRHEIAVAWRRFVVAVESRRPKRWPARHEIAVAWRRFVAVVQSRRPNRPQMIFYILGFFALGVMAVPLSIMTDNFTVFSGLFSLEYWTDEKGAQRSEVTRNVGLMSAAVIGLILAVWRSFIADKQRALTERGLITDRINKAVENLGHQTTTVKLGGVHALWRLIEEIPGRDKNARRNDVKMILDILTAFVRHDEESRVTLDEYKHPILRVDVETAVQLLGDKDAFYRSIMPNNYQLDLRRANLSGARLDFCDFQNTNFLSANLSNAALVQTNFSETYLVLTEFYGAKMCAANMRGAILVGAHLSNADFSGSRHMTQEQIDSAVWHEDFPPKLPEGLIFPPQKPK